MNSHLVANPSHTDRQRRRDGTSLSGASAQFVAQRLSRRAALMLALLLSIGLWGITWVAVTSLASAVLR